MRKIVKGFAYDTDTATLIGDTNTPQYKCYKHQQLYRKRSGEYFLVDFDRGGWDKMDSVAIKIRPISIDDAREWCEKHLSAEDYEKEFGEAAEDDSRVTTTLTLERKNYDKLKSLAVEAKKPVSKFMDDVIEKL